MKTPRPRIQLTARNDPITVASTIHHGIGGILWVSGSGAGRIAVIANLPARARARRRTMEGAGSCDRDPGAGRGGARAAAQRSDPAPYRTGIARRPGDETEQRDERAALEQQA